MQEDWTEEMNMYKHHTLMDSRQTKMFFFLLICVQWENSYTGIELQ